MTNVWGNLTGEEDAADKLVDAGETVVDKSTDLLSGGLNSVNDTSTDSSGDSVSTAVSTVETALDSAKEKADAFAKEYGEENAWNALVEAAAGKTTEGAAWAIDNFGPQLIDLMIIYGTWSQRVAGWLPPKVRIPLQVSSIISLVGASAAEGVINTLADKGVVSKEVANNINEYGLEPASKANLRSILTRALFNKGNTPDDLDKALGDYYDDPERGGFQKAVGWLQGYNQGGTVCGPKIKRSGIYKH